MMLSVNKDNFLRGYIQGHRVLINSILRLLKKKNRGTIQNEDGQGLQAILKAADP